MGTLTYSAVEIDIPEALEWANEFSNKTVEQKTQFSVTGALLVESKAKQAGRKIELKGSERYTWMLRSDVTTLRTWADIAGAEIELEFHGQTFTVMFDHEAGAMETTDVAGYEDADGTDFTIPTFRFITV